MKRYKAIAIVMIMILAMGTLTGCTTFDHFKEAFIDNPKDRNAIVRIGVYEPMSGTDSEGGEAEIQGIELAHQLYPNVNGKIVELVYADNASDINAADTAIQELISKEPSVILGSYGSVYSLEAGTHVQEAEIPAIAITNTNPLVTTNNDYYFRVCYVDSNQGDILARYVLEEKHETTAGVLLPEDDDVAMATATAFTDRIKAETENEDAITAYEQYKTGDTDFSEQLTAIQSAGVKSVLLPGEINDSARILKQADQMGLDVVFLGDTDWSTDDFRKRLGNNVDGDHLAFVNFFVAEEGVSEEGTKFLDAYHDRYGSNSIPEDGVALGYDAYVIALNAIDKAADDADGKAVREVLAGQNSFQGASGEITFNTMGDPIKTAFISTWRDGEVESLYTVRPTM